MNSIATRHKKPLRPTKARRQLRRTTYGPWKPRTTSKESKLSYDALLEVAAAYGFRSENFDASSAYEELFKLRKHENDR